MARKSGRTPGLREHVGTTKKGTPRTWYTLEIGGREHYLGSNKSQAQIRAGALIAQHMAQPGAVHRPRNVAELVEAWQVERPGRAWVLIPFAKFTYDTRVAEPLNDLPIDTLERYVVWLQTKAQHRHVRKGRQSKKRGLLPWSVRQYANAARALLRWAHDREWVDRVPRSPKLPKPVERARDIPPAKLRAIFDALPDRAGRIFRFILATGCRPGEACRLEWQHVNLELGTAELLEHKTAHVSGQSRTIYLTPDAIDVLREIVRNEELPWVFISRLKRAYTPAGLRTILRRRAKGITPYQLRHTFAQFHADREDVPDSVLAGLMGHRSTRMIDTYRKVRDSRLRKAASGLASPLQPEVRRLDASLPPPAAADSAAVVPSSREPSRRKRASGPAA